MTASEKPCAGCKHVRYAADAYQYVCEHPNVSTKSVVTGRPIGHDADNCRFNARYCGPDGKWFEPAPTQVRP